MEIDENLARAELSPAEEAMHIARRKVVWDDLQREKAQETGARNSRSSLSDGREKGPQHERKFAAEVASNRTQLIACYPNEYLYCTLIRFGGTAL